MKDLQVVILAGGLGTRLMEKTKRIPKPLVSIGNKPIIHHIIKHYHYYGLKNFIICLGYKGDLIAKYFRKNIFKDINIKFVKTGINSLTAKRILKVRKFIKNDFFLTYGDGLSDININETYKFFKKKNKIGVVTAVNPDERYGILKIDRNYIVNDFSEKPKNSTHWINGGFFVFNKKLFNYLNKNKNEMLERETLKKLTKHKQLAAYHHKGFWKPMDTLRDKIELDKIWKSKKAKWKF